MSKINELIKELCPNGVLFKEIKELCIVTRGRVISKNELKENEGEYPVYSSQTLNNGIFGKINTYDFDGEYVQWTTDGANAGSIFYRNGKFSVTNVCGLLKIKDEYKQSMNTNFLNYILGSVSKNHVNYATSNPKLMSNVVEKIKVAVPPIEIQEEIVSILDRFNELETKLETELETRKRQYEFWRDNIFKNVNSKSKTIKELCTDVIVPMRDKPKVFDGNIPWCRIEDKDGNYFNTSKSGQFVSEATIEKMNLKVFPIGTVICSCSASIGSYAINTQPLITNQTFIGLVCGGEIINKYLFYYMQTQTNRLLELSNSGTIPYISRKKFEDLEVPVPSIEEQEKVVSILDKFDKLINDTSVGLPAEIKLRRKQYEYYRNKLLSFEELQNE